MDDGDYYTVRILHWAARFTPDLKILDSSKFISLFTSILRTELLKRKFYNALNQSDFEINHFFTGFSLSLSLS
jgi:hypothetical protein